MSQYVSLFVKGLAMGAANVIPGVSGGTIALITGIFERLIQAIRSVNLDAIKLLAQLKFSAFWTAIDGSFLASLALGIFASIISLAKLLEFLLASYEVETMAFFFGLILLSILYVGQRVTRWGTSSIVMLIVGTAIAAGIALLAPASENSGYFYVFLCGIVAICSMILPGLSGSFILIIMGNYALVLGAIGSMNFSVLVPLALGCGFGLIAFSHVLGWIFDKWHDQTIALMTGFILGSLAIIWPWKETITEMIVRDGKPPKEIVTGFDWFLPSLSDGSTWLALLLIVAGAACIWLVERYAATTTPGEAERHND